MYTLHITQSNASPSPPLFRFLSRPPINGLSNHPYFAMNGRVRLRGTPQQPPCSTTASTALYISIHANAYSNFQTGVKGKGRPAHDSCPLPPRQYAIAPED